MRSTPATTRAAAEAVAALVSADLPVTITVAQDEAGDLVYRLAAARRGSFELLASVTSTERLRAHAVGLADREPVRA